MDIAIRNAEIVDGTGRPAYRGDILIEDGLVAQVGECSREVDARRTIDATGLTAAPGFVDIHRHGDLVPLCQPSSCDELSQGITSFVNGNCGFSAFPSSREHFDELCEYAKPILGRIPPQVCAKSGSAFFSMLETNGLASNMGYLVGGGALRIQAAGFRPGPLQARELEQMRGLLRELLQAGALGMSMGLMYVPENFTSFEELQAICEVPASMGRIVTVHMRGEGGGLLQSVDEVIALARATGGKFHISHLKAAGRKYWNNLLPKALERIADAKRRGVDLSFDVYPYCAGSTALYTLLPPALQEGGMEALLKRLSEADTREALKADLRVEHEQWDNLIPSTGWESVTIVGGRDEGLIGRNMAEIAAAQGVDPVDCMAELLLANKGDVPMVIHSMSRQDMELALGTEGSILISDALYGEGGQPHPRRYGAFAKAVSQYAPRLGLEKVVQRASGLPASRMGLKKRGTILPGMAADVILLDRKRFKDRADYVHPRRLPDGLSAVIVNGRLALKDGELLGKHGTILYPNRIE